MANPNPRILVNKCYACSVFVGDLVAIKSVEEAQRFLDGIGDITRQFFPDTFIAASFDGLAQRGVFVFKKLDDARQLEANWAAVVAYYETGQ